MIQIDNLSKNYGPVQAVDSISFSLNDGEIVGFLGANGAGKSTTLKMITGYITPTSGNVTIGDKNIIDDCIDIQKMVGYLPELNPLYSEMKVHEYLKFHASIRGITGNEFIGSLKRVVSECGLQGVVHRTIGNCSKGYKQRIGLAAAMIHDPKIILLDEPLGKLDAMTREKIRADFQKLWMIKKPTVIFVTHSIEEAVQLSSRVILITPRPGKIDREIKIDLPYPRDLKVKRSPKFIEYVNSIQEVFHKYGVI